MVVPLVINIVLVSVTDDFAFGDMCSSSCPLFS